MAILLENYLSAPGQTYWPESINYKLHMAVVLARQVHSGQGLAIITTSPIICLPCLSQQLLSCDAAIHIFPSLYLQTMPAAIQQE